MNIAEHLERYLGRIDRGWSSDSLPGVQVCLFPDCPEQGLITLATLGLSNKVLGLGVGREVRQEIIIAFRPVTASIDEFVRVLMQFAERIGLDGRAVLRGDVIEIEGMEPTHGSLYAAIPVGFSGRDCNARRLSSADSNCLAHTADRK